MKHHRTASVLAVIALLAVAIFPLAPTRAAAWEDKVDAWVLETSAEGQTEFLVFLPEQADLSAAAQLETKLEKGTYVYEMLTEAADRTQGPLLAALDAMGLEHRAYWVANMVWVRGDQAAVEALASRPDVAHIYGNPVVRLDEPAVEAGTAPLSPDAIEWNILMVGADQVWGEGYTGQGVVIGGQDTGYDWDHPALIDQYRGWNGSSADHNYSWHDAIHGNDPHTPPGNPCGFDVSAPCDDNDHGTHTMGTMIGDDGGSNQIGMAPGARWIGCRNMEEGWGMPSTYSECYQWFIAPTDLNGQNPDPAMAPDVINNSWSCPSDEGCNPDTLLTIVQNVRAAGILTAHSAGNDGPACSTVNAPAAIYDDSFSVGSTTSTDAISSFSSRGPVTVDGSNRLKPDISAPGSNIRSSVPGGSYQSGWSGTSMAAPHVAGLVALLISAQPSLAGQVDVIETIIQDTALHLTSAQTCGGVPGSQIPNNTFGWGRIDAYAAYQAATAAPHELSVSKTGSLGPVAQGSLITYTLSLTHTHDVSITTGVVMTDVVPMNTTFSGATGPYTLTGSTVLWDFGSLGLNESQTVSFSVLVDPLFVGDIVNAEYGALSDDVPFVAGAPVVTTVGPALKLYLPAAMK